jgi:Fe-S-cluster containining protein
VRRRCCLELFGKTWGDALLPTEKVRLEKLAWLNGVTVNFVPLTKDLMGKVTTYQWTDKKCPFLNVYRQCMIYEARVGLCRAFP